MRNQKVVSKLFGGKGAIKEVVALDGADSALIDKATLFQFGQLILVALSLASAHYFGFLFRVPFEVLSVVTLSFLPYFISVFTLYFLLCYTLARISAFWVAQFYWSILHAISAFFLRLRRHWPDIFGRLSVKMHKEMSKADSFMYRLLLGLIFLPLFNFSYMRVELRKVDSDIWLFAGVIVLALFLRAGFLARNPKIAILRILDKKRVALRRMLIKSLVFSLVGGSLALSFYTGKLRFEKLISENTTSFKYGEYFGDAIILIGSSSAFLILERMSESDSFVYLNGKAFLKFSLKGKFEGSHPDAAPSEKSK